MKIILNTSYGAITDETAMRRLDPAFIEDVESGRYVGAIVEGWGYAETLRVFEVPDEATDYKIVNYDGCEGIIYCLYGHLYYVGSEEGKRIFENYEAIF